MFTRKDQLDKKGGVIERASYLQKIKEEFALTQSLECKRQILANLANFSYDPINYEFLKNLRVPELFLDQLSEDDDELLSHAVGGLCNLSCDPENVDYIIVNNGIYLLGKQLEHANGETAINALTALCFLINPNNCHLFLAVPEIIRASVAFKNSEDGRFRNLGTIFLEHYTPEQIRAACSV